MPLPWKKAKVGRISRLVAGLQQSPKRGGSLVVETGFPTSLIDLFVKNRDRLKKPSSKRRQTALSPSQRSSPPPPSPRRSSFSPASPPPLQKGPVERKPVRRDIGEPVGVNAEDRDAGDGGRGGCLFMAVLKVFVVAVLALSTKKLTVGITLSAFALLFLEFTAARAFRFLKLCPDARTRLDPLIRKVMGKQQKEKPIAIDDKNVITCEIADAFEDSRNCAEEIKVLESYMDAIPCPEPESVVIPDKNPRASSMNSKKAEFVAEREGETIRELMFKNERSRSSKLKSKIVKKIVPKKFRSCRKKKSLKIKEEKEEEESLSEISSLGSDEKFEKIEEEISERDEDYSNLPLQEYCREREFQVEMDDSSKKKEIRSKGDKGYVIILLVIVLAGLLGGRVLAIGLALFWCLLLRFAGKSEVEFEKKKPLLMSENLQL